MKHMSRMRHAGYTMIEMIIVMVIMSIVAALAVPMFSGSIQTRLTGAAGVMMSDLAYAQIESITHEQRDAGGVGTQLRLVKFDIPGNCYHIATVSDPNTPITNYNGEPYLQTFGQGKLQSFADVRLQSVSAGGDDELVFGLFGDIDQVNDAVITLECQGVTLTVNIDATSGEASVGDFN